MTYRWPTEWVFHQTSWPIPIFHQTSWPICSFSSSCHLNDLYVHSVGRVIWMTYTSCRLMKYSFGRSSIFLNIIIWTFPLSMSCHSNQMLSSNVVKITSFGRSCHWIWHVEFISSEDQIFIQLNKELEWSTDRILSTHH